MTKLTPIQTRLIGALVQTTKKLSYSSFTIPLGYPGILVDYGRISEYPIVEFFDGKRGIVCWDELTIVSEYLQTTKTNQQSEKITSEVCHERTC